MYTFDQYCLLRESGMDLGALIQQMAQRLKADPARLKALWDGGYRDPRQWAALLQGEGGAGVSPRPSWMPSQAPAAPPGAPPAQGGVSPRPTWMGGDAAQPGVKPPQAPGPRPTDQPAPQQAQDPRLWAKAQPGVKPSGTGAAPRPTDQPAPQQAQDPRLWAQANLGIRPPNQPAQYQAQDPRVWAKAQAGQGGRSGR